MDSKERITTTPPITPPATAKPPRPSLPTSRSVQLVRKEIGTSQHYIVSTLGEFCGTVLFLFFAYAGVQVGKSALGGDPTTTGEYLVFLLFGATSFGASLAINVWIFYRVSGGLFNPAVTFAFVLTGLMHPLKGAVIFVTQLLAGITAAAIIDALTPGPLSVANSLGPNVNVAQGLFMEMFLTAELILAIFMLAVEKHRATYLAPLGIGIALFIGHIVGIYFTGAGLNPARSLGPAVVQHKFPGYHWIYWVGPGLGALLASALYKLLIFYNMKQPTPTRTSIAAVLSQAPVNSVRSSNSEMILESSILYKP